MGPKVITHQPPNLELPGLTDRQVGLAGPGTHPSLAWVTEPAPEVQCSLLQLGKQRHWD